MGTQDKNLPSIAVNHQKMSLYQPVDLFCHFMNKQGAKSYKTLVSLKVIMPLSGLRLVLFQRHEEHE